MLTTLVPLHFLPHLKLSKCQLFFGYSSWSTLHHHLTPVFVVKLLTHFFIIIQGTRCCNWQTVFPLSRWLSRAHADAETSKLVLSSIVCCIMLCEQLAELQIQPVLFQTRIACSLTASSDPKPLPPKHFSSDLHKSRRSPKDDSFASL
jgi:hypothetical protein